MHHLPSCWLAVRVDELYDLHSVGEELVVEYPVSCLHGDQDCHNVESFPEEKLLVIVIVVALEINEILSNFNWSRLESVSLAVLPLPLPRCLVVMPLPSIMVLMFVILILVLVLPP